MESHIATLTTAIQTLYTHLQHLQTSLTATQSHLHHIETNLDAKIQGCTHILTSQLSELTQSTTSEKEKHKQQQQQENQQMLLLSMMQEKMSPAVELELERKIQTALQHSDSRLEKRIEELQKRLLTDLAGFTLTREMNMVGLPHVTSSSTSTSTIPSSISGATTNGGWLFPCIERILEDALRSKHLPELENRLHHTLEQKWTPRLTTHETTMQHHFAKMTDHLQFHQERSNTIHQTHEKNLEAALEGKWKKALEMKGESLEKKWTEAMEGMCVDRISKGIACETTARVHLTRCVQDLETRVQILESKWEKEVQQKAKDAACIMEAVGRLHGSLERQREENKWGVMTAAEEAVERLRGEFREEMGKLKEEMERQIKRRVTRPVVVM
jgi:hypothetical protein